MSIVVPIYLRWALLAALAAISGFLGWGYGAAHVQAKWDADSLARERVVSVQAARTAKVEAAQAAVSREETENVQADLDAVRSFYADRVRQPAAVCGCPVPEPSRAAERAAAASSDPGSAAAGDGIRVESYEQLAARCAETTVIARGWQRWWGGIEQAHTGGNDAQDD
ncbi:MAG: hypothetical protein LLG01_05390 [Planctomycetaceae bacterium]|nr:hypothetical protein [Planctomycetaceae bacterium]